MVLLAQYCIPATENRFLTFVDVFVCRTLNVSCFHLSTSTLRSIKLALIDWMNKSWAASCCLVKHVLNLNGQHATVTGSYNMWCRSIYFALSEIMPDVYAISLVFCIVFSSTFAVPIKTSSSFATSPVKWFDTLAHTCSSRVTLIIVVSTMYV